MSGALGVVLVIAMAYINARLGLPAAERIAGCSLVPGESWLPDRFSCLLAQNGGCHVRN